MSNIRELNNYFKIQVGFSDHTTGIDAAIQAISYGAKVIEKHFVPTKGSSKSADYPLSINYKQLSIMKEKINTSFEMIGEKKDRVLSCEIYGEKNLKRSIYAKKNIKKGDKIMLKDLICIRPFQKKVLNIENFYKVNNKKATRDIFKNSLLTKKDFK